MIIYIAGGGSGNNNYIWRDNHKQPKKAMDIFIAGLYSEKNRANYQGDFKDRIAVLESFFYIKEWMLPYIENYWDFMLDSGAFTYFGTGDNDLVDWVEYTERYGRFVREHNIRKFIELDLDNLIGIEKTRGLRNRLEDIVGRRSIPVWRPFRGIDYYHEMIENYDYIALSASGAYDSKWTRKNKSSDVIEKMIHLAHQNNTKIHGLGYTKIPMLKRHRFDSVDSTAWLYGNRGGFLYKFNGQNFDKIKKPKGTRLNARATALHNFREWVKFQQYAKDNL